MSGLAGRIAARLDALEAGARDVVEFESGGEWESYALPDPGPNHWTMTGVGVKGDDMGHRTETMFPKDAAHIAAWDPAAVLRLMDRLRAVVALHAEQTQEWIDLDGDSRVGFYCAECEPEYGKTDDTWPCPTVLALAAALGVEVGE